MATLRELMGDLTRGDGRKFRKNKWHSVFWFEPIFQEFEGDWFGIDQDGFMQSFCDNDSLDWEPYTEPKEKKKVKMYRPIRKIGTPGQYAIADTWHQFKSWFQEQYTDIVGWQEMEIEVDE